MIITPDIFGESNRPDERFGSPDIPLASDERPDGLSRAAVNPNS